MGETDEDVGALRIIGAALIAGPAILLAIAIFLRSDPESALVEVEKSDRAVITWTSLFLGVALIGTSLALPQPKGGDIARIRSYFITRLALVEGGALFGAVAYLVEGETCSVGISAVCLAVMATLHFPTRERVDRLRAERP